MPGSSVLRAADREPLFAGGVLDQHDRPVARFAPPAVDRLVHHRFVGAGRQREHVQGLFEVLGLLAHQRDVEGAVILDQDLAVAVEQHAARRRQRQPPEMILLGHLRELLVLRDLEHPERHGEHGEQHGDDELERRQPHRQAAAVFRHHHGCADIGRVLRPNRPMKVPVSREPREKGKRQTRRLTRRACLPCPVSSALT